mgnify:CR=1 FL=1
MNYEGGSARDFVKMYQAPYSVAILTPTESGNPGQIVAGFVQENIKSNKKLRHYIYSSNGYDFDSVNQAVNRIIYSDHLPNVVVTVGTSCTRAFLEKIKEKGIDIPVVHAGMAKDDLDLSEYEGFVSRLAGVYVEQINLLEAASFLYMAKPTIKKILIPYQSHVKSETTQEQVSFLQDYFTSRGVSVSLLSVYNAPHLYNTVCRELPKYDTLFLLEGGLSLGHHRSFAYECIHNNITLFACSIDAPAFGSVMGYAMDFMSTGKEAFSLTQQVAYGSESAEEVSSVCLMGTRKMYVNFALCSVQGVDSLLLKKAQDIIGAESYEVAQILTLLKQREPERVVRRQKN